SNAGKPKEHISEMPKDQNKIRKPERLKKISKPEEQKKKINTIKIIKKAEKPEKITRNFTKNH
ncbi:6482_t:CDS:1, partial [Cetraspora pellucida]